MGDPEPVVDWSGLRAGQSFPEIRWDLADGWIDAYLAATGEEDALYRERGFAPPLCMSLVRFVKAALGGRWPPGTLQLAERWKCVAPLRRNESVGFDLRVESVEQWDGRPCLALSSRVRDARGALACEQAMSLLWPTAVPDAHRLPAASRGGGRARVNGEDGARIGPLTDQFSLSRVRAFAAVAAADDPIHVDPAFARTTRSGTNIVQGKLVMTLISRLMLGVAGAAWLERGRLDLRFRRPVVVDEPVQAWAQPHGGAYRVWCENARGEDVIEGTAAA